MAINTQKTQTLLDVGPFLGIDNTTTPYFVDPQHAVDSQNVLPSKRYQGFVTTNGRSSFCPDSAYVSGGLSNIYKWLGEDSSFDETTNYFLPAYNHGLYVANPGVAPTSIISSFPTKFISLGSYGNYAFYADDYGTTKKIDNNLAVTNWGIGSPAPPTLALGSAGNLSGVYSYVVTYGNAVQESSPSTIVTIDASPLPAFVDFTFSGTATSTGAFEFQINGGPNLIFATINNGNTAAQIVNSFFFNDSGGINATLEESYPGQFVASSPSSTVLRLTCQTGGLQGDTNVITTTKTGTGWSYTPTAATNFSGANAGNEVDISNIPVSGDPQVTERNIYRVGGTLSEFRLIHTIADNTTTTYTDNTADVDVTGQTLVLHRDPPQNFFAIVSHKNRVWGLGYSNPNGDFDPTTYNDVWYSNYNEPWGFDDTNQVIPIEPGIGGDRIIGGFSNGSIIFVLTRYHIHGIIGDSPADFVPRKLADIGCVARDSIAQAYGYGFWLNDQGVYMFDGADAPQNISDGLQSKSSIKHALESYSQADLQAAKGFIYDRMYGLSFPTQNVTWLFFIPTGQWYRLGWATDSVCFDLENLNEVTGFRPGTAHVDSWFSTGTDLGNPITSFFTTGISSAVGENDGSSSTKQFNKVVLLAPGQTGASAMLTTTVNPGLSQIVHAKTIDLGVGDPRHVYSLPPNMVGTEAQLNISITSSAQTEVQKATIYGWPKRVLVQAG